MEKLKKYFSEIGYSGHFPGIDDAITALCYGAKYVEKHFTIDQNLPGRDNKFAIMPTDLNRLYNFRNNLMISKIFICIFLQTILLNYLI